MIELNIANEIKKLTGFQVTIYYEPRDITFHITSMACIAGQPFGYTYMVTAAFAHKYEYLLIAAYSLMAKIAFKQGV